MNIKYLWLFTFIIMVDKKEVDEDTFFNKQKRDLKIVLLGDTAVGKSK